jgi:hypothetical protein
MARSNFWNFKNKKDKIKQLYTDPNNLVTIEFANRTDVKRFVWVEPTCVSIELDASTEYQVVTHDKTFRIEFDKDGTIIFYLQYSFGFILNKRPASKEVNNPNDWILDLDYSEIN